MTRYSSLLRWACISAVILASVLLTRGVTLPVMQVARYQLWKGGYALGETKQVSLIDMALTFHNESQYFLAAVLAALVLVLPVVLLYQLFMLVVLPQRAVVRHTRTFGWLGAVASWSMLDVFVLSLIIFLAKNQAAYTSANLTGLMSLAGAVVLMWFVQYATRLPKARTALSEPVWWCMYLLLLACIIIGTWALALGITESIVRFTALSFLHREYSVISLTQTLHEKGHLFLFWVLCIFSIVFPTAKLVVLTGIASFWHTLSGHARLVHTVEWVGRYSMTDIIVLTILIYYMNGSGYTESVVLPGTYYFTTSVAATMLGFMCAGRILHTDVGASKQEGT